MSHWTRSAVVLASLITLAAAPAPPTRTPIMHATGTFEVKLTPEAQGEAPADGRPTARMALDKTFSGAMTGRAIGTMLSVGTPKPGEPAAYVAVDQFAGTVDGRKGGFVLLHRGTADRAGNYELSVTIAPDTGTGALTGIAGTFTIRQEAGVHHYELSYTLPAS